MTTTVRIIIMRAIMASVRTIPIMDKQILMNTCSLTQEDQEKTKEDGTIRCTKAWQFTRDGVVVITSILQGRAGVSTARMSAASPDEFPSTV